MTPQVVGQQDVGQFVVGDPELGIGRLVGLDAGTARIRYFRGPLVEPFVERQWDRSEVVLADIRPHSRVYYHDGRRWRIGRVDAEHPSRDGRYAIALPNSDGEILAGAQFDVRWRAPIENPYEILASLGSDSPSVYEPRVDLIGSWHRIRAAGAGVEGLLLSSVELHDHQLTVVRSVSNDTNRRYLLADEVGLGKTIEAAALVRQALVDDPTGDALVLAPDHLRQQWAEELLDKFHTGEFGSASIRVRAHDDPDSWPDDPPRVLVVDEAHHLTRAGPFGQAVISRVAALAHGATDVFLLSATPVRSNEVAFLDLLHLLDPANYQPTDVEAFTRRVELRDDLAMIHHSLTPDLDEFDLSLYADELQSTFPEDDTLARLVHLALEAEDTARPERIGQVRDHLSATYRLHHRLLRTRRTPEISETFGVRGRRRGRPFTIEIGDDTDHTRTGLLESFRQHLAELVDSGLELRTAAAAFGRLGEVCGSLPQALLEFVELPTPDGPDELAHRWLSSQGDAWKHSLEAAAPGVLEATVQQLGAIAISRDVGKIVVASAHRCVAEAVSSALSSAFGSHRVAEHTTGIPRDENAASVDRWRDDPDCRVLVCDSSAEEGINLQAADAVVHLDLPWEVFRLEQRMGRADRFVREKSTPVGSMVIIYGEQPYALGWFLFAADSCGVFDQSASSLQYVLADLESQLLGRVITEGVGLFDEDIEVRRERLEAEARRIAAHDSLDAVSAVHRELNGRLLSEDRAPDLGNALKKWLAGVGAKLRTPSRGTVQIAARPRLQVPFGLEVAVAPWMERELALTRHAATARGVQPVRPGHGLLDAIVGHLQDDERGVAFAFMRPAKGCWPPVPVFRTDFIVRAAQGDHLDQAAVKAGLGVWLAIERESSFSPLMETVYTSDDGSEVATQAVIRPYDRGTGDRNLASRPQLFDSLTTAMNWEDVCATGLRNARRVLDTRESVFPRAAAAARVLRSVIDAEVSSHHARVTAGLGTDHDRLNALEAVGSSVPDELSLEIDVVGCGAIVLADPARIGA